MPSQDVISDFSKPFHSLHKILDCSLDEPLTGPLPMVIPKDVDIGYVKEEQEVLYEVVGMYAILGLLQMYSRHLVVP